MVNNRMDLRRPIVSFRRRSSRPVHRLVRNGMPLTLLAGLFALAACTSPQPRPAARAPAEVRAQLIQMIPSKTPDRAAWAADIQASFQLLDLPPSTENLCAALAVIAQESTYDADPVVPGLARIAREEINRRAAQHHIPAVAVSVALKLKSPDGRSYAERLSRVQTEKQLSVLFEDLLSQVPLGRRLFADANPVRTGGPMQVSIDFAERYAQTRPYPFAEDGSIRHAAFTRRGGLYFGIAHLLGYPNRYERHLFRFADFNAGWYASRNAAFQNAVTVASGVTLALDGDLVLPSKLGATEAAVRSLGPDLGLGDRAIHRQLLESDRFEFEETDVYRAVFALAEQRHGSALPRAVMPRIRLESPKITRKLTTEWFANRVQSRYQTCVNEAFARMKKR